MKTRLIVAAVLASMGCSGDDPVVPESVASFVAGYARRDTVAKEPVSGLKVDLVMLQYIEGYGGGWYPTSWHRSTCTNADGYFSFKFNANTSRKYEAVAYRVDDLLIESEFAWVDVPIGNTKNVILKIPLWGTPVKCN